MPQSTRTPDISVPLIEVRDVKKHFPLRVSVLAKVLTRRRDQTVKAVDGVTLKVWTGETVGLVGESGCGKTTLGRIMARLHEPTDGHLLFRGQPIVDGQVVAKSAPHHANAATQSTKVAGGNLVASDATPGSTGEEQPTRRIPFSRVTQIIFQNPFSSLNPRKTVGSIIGVALRQGGMTNSADRNAETLRLLNRVGLSERHIDAYPHQFSGGQRQRIGIARALAVRPEFIVADEPVSALDVSIQAQVINLLQDLQQEYQLTYLFIAHDLSVIRHMSDRVVVMYLGHIVEEGTTQELFENPLHPYTQALLAAIPVMEKRARRDRIILEGTVPNPVDPPSGCPFHTRCFVKKGPECVQEYPPVIEADGHRVACWLYVDDGTTVSPAIPDPVLCPQDGDEESEEGPNSEYS